MSYNEVNFKTKLKLILKSLNKNIESIYENKKSLSLLIESYLKPDYSLEKGPGCIT